MDKKTKFDFEIEEFNQIFGNIKERKIALYGAGRMTATLLSRLNGYNIVGICDRDSSMTGKEMYGVKVIDRATVEKIADLIIINTSESYWNTIYQRIHDWNIPIYFRNGILATNKCLEKNCNSSYWKKNYEELRNIIKNYDVVSFDIFDTLIMRKTYLPSDIFYLVENILQKQEGINFSFVEARNAVVSRMENATIHEIYEQLGSIAGWDQDKTEKIKQLEIETEKRFLVPRKDMTELYWEISQEKETYFISDMYLPADILIELLDKCGIEIDPLHILVSCDCRKTKSDGKLWEYYSNELVKGRKAIHIGDDEKNDGEMPHKYGIDSYTIWSKYQMLQMTFMNQMTSEIHTLFESVLVGMYCAKLLNSPFALQKSHGKVLFRDEKEAGYCLFGSVMYVFCDWLWSKVKDLQEKQLLFFARDGYFISKIFQYFCDLNNGEVAPEIIYLEISRRSVMVTTILSDKDIVNSVKFPYYGNVKNFFKTRFGINVERKDLEQMPVETLDKNSLEIILKEYKNEILMEASKERKNYLAYLNSLNIKEDFAIVELGLYGTTQYYLGKLLGKRLRGYYFFACLDESNAYLGENIMEACFPGKKILDGKDSNIFKNALLVEAFLTAPNGMFECIKDDGEKQYSQPKNNQKKFSVRYEMLDGIKEFISEMWKMDLEYDFIISEEDIYFVDRLFGNLMNNGFEATAMMKESFYYDNAMLNDREYRIWE